jgi:molybdopterin-containing oxidoreductase family iron-sulfur binding subunit
MSQDTNINKYRRQFLSTASSALAGITIAPGVMLSQVAHADMKGPASSKNRWGMLIDASKCATGCNSCVTACHKENGVTVKGNPTTDAQWIRKVKLTDKVTGQVQTLPLLCQHCANPPCVDVCPTNASMKRDDGIVLVDKHACIGCRYCMMACPYHARSFVHEKVTEQKYPRGQGTVESCTLCVHRIDASDGTQNPACVDACNAEGHKAMWFGDMSNPDSEISKQLKQYGGEQIRADLGLNTGVRYQNLS